MNLNNNDYVIRLLILIETLVLIFACIVLFILLPNNFWAVIFIADAGAVLIIYTFVRYRQRKKVRLYVGNMIKSLDAISSEKDESLMLVIDDPQMIAYYSKVREIRENFLAKDFNRKKILNIVNSVAINIEIENLLEDLMPKLVEVTESNCGAFYLANNTINKLEIKHSIGFSKNIYSEFDLALGESFVGIAAISKEIKVINDIPEDSVYVMRTFLGKIKPKSMMVVPIVSQEQLLGVFTFASLKTYSDAQLEIVNLIKYYVGAAVGNSLTYEKTRRLTSELKFQNRLIQNLNDDLESKVLERTNSLNNILDSISEYVIYTTDRDGIILVWNKRAQDLFGYPASDIVGKHVTNIYSSTEIEENLLEKIVGIVENEGVYTKEYWYTKKDLTKYFIRKTLYARKNQNGDIVGFTNITKDLTTLKNMESYLLSEELHASMHIYGSSEMLVFTDLFGVIICLSIKAKELLSSDLVIGKAIYGFFENGENLEDNAKEILENQTEGNWTFKLKNKNIKIDINVNVIENKVNSSKILSFKFLL